MPLPDADRPVDVLDLNLAAIGKADVEAAADAFVDDRGDTDAAGIGERFQARGDVDAIAVDVVAIDDNVAEVDANPEDDAVFRLDGALDVERTADRVDDTSELDEGAIADQLDHPAPVARDRRIEDAFPVALQGAERPGLIGTDHAGIADHVGRENCGEPTSGLVFAHGRIGMGYPRDAPAPYAIGTSGKSRTRRWTSEVRTLSTFGALVSSSMMKVWKARRSWAMHFRMKSISPEAR